MNKNGAHIPTIFLFDMDNVLIYPGGYRQAFWASLQYFIDLIGIKVNSPDEDELDFIESIGITSEWDMLPICLALILNDIFSIDTSLNHENSLEKVFKSVQKNTYPQICIDYRQSFSKLRNIFVRDLISCDSLIASQKKGEAKNLFPNIQNMQIWNDIFENSRDVSKSKTTLVFQHYVLGNKKFEDVYCQQESFTCDSMLMKFDHSLLVEQMRNQLCGLSAQYPLRFSIYTLRPSYPPKEVYEQVHGFSPEAEMALSIVGLNDIPVISYGRMLYLSEKLKFRVENVIKPSPVQALSAIAAAWSGNEIKSIEWAFHAYKRNQYRKGADFSDIGIDLPDRFQINVFEDSTSGMRSAIEAVNILNSLGYKADLKLWGIAVNEDKVHSLKELGANIHDNINSALFSALQKYPIL